MTLSIVSFVFFFFFSLSLFFVGVGGAVLEQTVLVEDFRDAGRIKGKYSLRFRA